MLTFTLHQAASCAAVSAAGRFPRSVHALPGAQFTGQTTIKKVMFGVTFAAAAVAHNVPIYLDTERWWLASLL